MSDDRTVPGTSPGTAPSTLSGTASGTSPGTARGTAPGRLLVLAAPSGAGKTTLVRALLERVPNLSFSVSYTTRPARPGERDGID